MTRTRVSWRCAAGHTLLAIRGLRQSGQFTHPLPGGRTCTTTAEPERVEIPVPRVAEVMSAALVHMPVPSARERREERAARAEWPPYEGGL